MHESKDTILGGDAPRGAGQHVGIDLDPSRRPGVPRLRQPEPLPNTRYPPEPQQSDVEVFMHGRPHKDFPPVYGTDVPPHGLSGLVRKAAYHYPDHVARHWLMLLFADRVDMWEHRAKKLLPFALPAFAGALLARGLLKRRARPSEEERNVDPDAGRRQWPGQRIPSDRVGPRDWTYRGPAHERV